MGFRTGRKLAARLPALLLTGILLVSLAACGRVGAAPAATPGGLSVTPTPDPNAHLTPIEWADAQFEACVRAMLGIPEGDVMPSDVAGVTALYFFGNAVCRTRDAAYAYDAAADTVTQGSRVYACKQMSLADAAHFPNLDTLAVYGGRITGGYGALERITRLTIAHAPFLDLTDVARPQLTSLSLIDCHIADVSPLGRCAALTELNLSGNRVKDLTPLQALPLTVLNLTNCGVTDYSDVPDAVRIVSGAVAQQTATLGYGGTLKLSGTSFGGYDFGARSVAWRSLDPGLATVAADGTVTAGAVQYDPEAGYFTCNIVGQPDNSDVQLICTLTVGDGKVYTAKWAGRAKLSASCIATPKRYSSMIKNCSGFSLVTRQTAVKGDPFRVPWQVWVRENGRKWVMVHTFSVTPGEYQYLDVRFDAPMQFNMVAVTASDTSATVGTANGGFSVYGLRWALGG